MTQDQQQGCVTAPCITGNAKYIHHYGADTIHLTFKGNTIDNVFQALIKKKEQASLKRDLNQCVTVIAGCEFSVLPYGSGRSPLALKNEDFFVTVARPESSLPAVLIQIKSEACFKYGASEACKIAEKIAASLAKITDCSLSRADICADFETDFNMRKLSPNNLVSRAKTKAFYYTGTSFDGCSIGMGSETSFRLYDKTKEIKKTYKEHWVEKWKNAGYDGTKPVMRAEFQLKRNALVLLGIKTYQELFFNMDSLWKELSTKWLRIVEYSETDKNKSRWGVAGFWKMLVDFIDDEFLPILKKETPGKVSIAGDRYRYTSGLAALIGFMALHKRTDLGAALQLFWQDAEKYHGGQELLFNYIKSKYKNYLHKLSKLDDVKTFFVGGPLYLRKNLQTSMGPIIDCPF
jgi:hypothetical protein